MVPKNLLTTLKNEGKNYESKCILFYKKKQSIFYNSTQYFLELRGVSQVPVFLVVVVISPTTL